MKRIKAFVAAALLFTSQIDAQQLTGYITDGEDTPLPYANVVLLKSDSTLISGTTTDNDGLFTTERTADAGLLQISCLGFKERYIALTGVGDNIGTIKLSADSYSLNEVTVLAKRPAVKMTGTALSVDVAGSPLSKDTDIMEILRKVPGLTRKGGAVTTFTGSTPIYYINGRKVTDISQVENLDAKNVKSIEFDSNPGSEHDASTEAIVRIITKTALEGWSVKLEGGIEQAQNLSGRGGIRMNYNHKRLNISSSFRYNGGNSWQMQEMNNTINSADTVWHHNTDIFDKRANNRQYVYSFGVDYKPDDNQNIGIQYDGNNYREASKPYSMTITTADGNLYTATDGISEALIKDAYNHVNAYYSGKLSDRYTLNVYADYIHKFRKVYQDATEHDSRQDTYSGTLSNDISIYNMYAVNPTLKYKINQRSTVNIGAEYSRVDGDNKLLYNSKFGDSHTDNEESKYAAYASYALNLDKFSLTAGLRYEGVHYEYNDKLDASNNINRNYSDLFPSMSLSLNTGNVSHGLSYRSGINRPSFGYLSGNTFYVNRFLYQRGNPQLQSYTFHTVQYNMMYDFIYFLARYRYNKNYAGNNVYQAPDSPSTLVFSYKNYDKSQNFMIMLNMQKRWGFYEPALTVVYLDYIMDVDVMGEKYRVDDPSWCVTFNNYFYLPWKLQLNVEYVYNGGGSYEMFITKSDHQFNAKLQRSFCHDRLQVNLSANDIFNRSAERTDCRINNVNIVNRVHRDTRSVSLSLVYTFNNYKSSYKGKSAAQDIMDRL